MDGKEGTPVEVIDVMLLCEGLGTGIEQQERVSNCLIPDMCRVAQSLPSTSGFCPCAHVIDASAERIARYSGAL
jgi:hypothetical protein